MNKEKQLTYLEALKAGTLVFHEDEKVCDRCNSNYNSNDVFSDDDLELCGKCREIDAVAEWLSATVDDLLSGAKENGWTLEKHSASSGSSQYFTFSRGDNELSVRVADHGDCYCTTDISIDPDGNTIEQVLVKFKNAAIVKANGN